MTEPDLDELSALWRENEHTAELRALENNVRKHANRMKLLAIAELIGSMAVGALILWIMVVIPEPIILLAGGAAMAVLIWSQYRAMRLRSGIFDLTEGDAGTLIDLAIRQADSAIRRIRVGLFALGPATLLGTLLGQAIVWTKGRDSLRESVFSGASGWLTTGLGITILLALAYVSFRSLRKRQAELKRLMSWRQDIIAGDEF